MKTFKIEITLEVEPHPIITGGKEIDRAELILDKTKKFIEKYTKILNERSAQQHLMPKQEIKSFSISEI